MQSRTRRTALLLAVTFSAGTALAFGPGWTRVAPQELPQDPNQEQHEESPLGAAMEHMNASMRKVRRALKAGDGEVALASLSEFQQHVIAAKVETPPSAAKLPEAERAAFVSAFRTTLVDVLRVTCDMEVALIEGRLDEAGVIFAERLHPLEDAGHERFGGEE